MRGYAAIGLHRPIDKKNIGSVLRAAYCYGAAMVPTRDCMDLAATVNVVLYDRLAKENPRWRK